MRLESQQPWPEMGPTLEFLRLVWSVDHGLQSASKRMESTLGVTGPQRLALRIVGRFPGLLAGQLAALLHVHPSTVSGIVKRLERRKLLCRRADPRDKRRVALGLTEAGRTLLRTSKGTVEEKVEGVMSRLPAAKLAAAKEVLTALAGALENVD